MNRHDIWWYMMIYVALNHLRPFAERRWSLWCALVSRRAATKTRRRAATGRKMTHLFLVWGFQRDAGCTAAFGDVSENLREVPPCSFTANLHWLDLASRKWMCPRRHVNICQWNYMEFDRKDDYNDDKEVANKENEEWGWWRYKLSPSCIQWVVQVDFCVRKILKRKQNL